MRTNRFHLVSTLLLALALVGTAAACTTDSGASDDAPESGAGTEVQDLFVLEAGSAWAELGPTGDTATLHLSGVDDDVLVFADRPARTAGSMSAVAFVDSWQDFGFADVAPNAAIVIPDAPAGARPTAVALSTPRFDATAATLDIQIEALDGQHLDWLALLTAETADANGSLSLFIDSVPDANIDTDAPVDAAPDTDATDAPDTNVPDTNAAADPEAVPNGNWRQRHIELPSTGQVTITKKWDAYNNCASGDGTEYTNLPAPNKAVELGYTTVSSGTCFFESSKMHWQVMRLDANGNPTGDTADVAVNQDGYPRLLDYRAVCVGTTGTMRCEMTGILGDNLVLTW